MDDNSVEPKEKETETSEGDVSPIIVSSDELARRPSENVPPRILFAPDPRDRRRRSEDIAALTLTRTFSRQSRFSSYSAVTDEEHERAKRVTTRRSVDPQTRLPTGT